MVSAGGTGEHFWVPLAELDQCPPAAILEHWSGTSTGTQTSEIRPDPRLQRTRGSGRGRNPDSGFCLRENAAGRPEDEVPEAFLTGL